MNHHFSMRPLQFLLNPHRPLVTILGTQPASTCSPLTSHPHPPILNVWRGYQTKPIKNKQTSKTSPSPRKPTKETSLAGPFLPGQANREWCADIPHQLRGRSILEIARFKSSTASYIELMIREKHPGVLKDLPGRRGRRWTLRERLDLGYLLDEGFRNIKDIARWMDRPEGEIVAEVVRQEKSNQVIKWLRRTIRDLWR